MRPLDLLDTFPEFEAFWARAGSDPLEVQIDRWEREYMGRWPELLALQKEDYRKLGVDWRRIARTRIFPFLEERLGRLRVLHDELVRQLPGDWRQAQRALGIDFPVKFVVYVGVGCGTGWATRYGGKPACLFGLENAAEVPVAPGRSWPGAVSHELAHLVQDEWRRRAGVDGTRRPRGPYWQLFQEGFATYCERDVEPSEVFRRRTRRKGWWRYCEAHRAWLAAKFLRDVKARRSVRPFFGSWYSIQGQIETGYYLGSEVVAEWRRTLSLREIAVLPAGEARTLARAALERIARAGD